MLKVSSMTRDSVTLRWFAPISDGGAPVNKYIIMRRQVPINIWEEAGVVDGHTNSYTCINLREGRQYYFAVYAVNANGKSPNCELIRPVIPKRLTGMKDHTYF